MAMEESERHNARLYAQSRAYEHAMKYENSTLPKEREGHREAGTLWALVTQALERDHP